MHVDGPQRQAAWQTWKCSTEHALHGPGRPHRAPRGRRRREVIMVVSRRRHTVLWSWQRGPRPGGDQRYRPRRHWHDGGRCARHHRSLSRGRRSWTRRRGRQLLRRWAQARWGRSFVLAVALRLSMLKKQWRPDLKTGIRSEQRNL